MATYKIEFKKSAAKEFASLSKNVKIKILDSLQVLSANPYTEILSIKKLKGLEKAYRLRIGDYRVIYSVESNVLTIMVIKIGRRKDIYKKL